MARNKLNKKGSRMNSNKSLYLVQNQDYGVFYEIEKMMGSMYGSRVLRILYGIDGNSSLTGILRQPLPFKKY